MIEAGIDEVTMILLPVSELLNSPDRRWYDIANEMVFEAEDFYSISSGMYVVEQVVVPAHLLSYAVFAVGEFFQQSLNKPS